MVKPSASATLAIVTAASPPASASSIAASTIASWLSSRFGPRAGASCMPHATASTRGSPASVTSAMPEASGLCTTHSVYVIFSL